MPPTLGANLRVTKSTRSAGEWAKPASGEWPLLARGGSSSGALTGSSVLAAHGQPYRVGRRLGYRQARDGGFRDRRARWDDDPGTAAAFETAARDDGVADLTATSERRTLSSSQRASDRAQDLFHLFPYHFVAEAATNDTRVLEVGFGEGYGADVLGPVVTGYVGLEVAEEAVKHAVAHHLRDNVRFELYDGTTIPFASESFDVVISFHVLEHLSSPTAFVAELGRVCRAGGRVVLVTPNAAFRLSPGERPWSRFHLREFTADELMQLLSAHFDHSTVMGIAGNEEMNRLERARVSRARRLARLDPLGLRYRLPEALLLPLRRLLMSTTGSRRSRVHEMDFSLASVRCVGDQLDQAPHLIAVSDR